MKKQILVLFFALSAVVATAQHEHHGTASASESKPAVFKDQKLSAAYSHYIELKDALVAADGAMAKNVAASLQKSLGAVTNGKKAADEAAKIAAASGIDEQRKFLSDLSKEMSLLVKGGKLSSGNIYLEYCPMANSNQGGYWLSNEKEIRNPYFGQKMLKCGSVSETIQ